MQRLTAIAAAAALALGATTHAQARRSPVPAQTKPTAERNVVRVVARRWAYARIPMLIDARTGLLRNNVRAICHARGRRLSGRRYTRFVCVVRPWPTAGKKELLVTYRALAHGRFRIGWLRLQRRK
jgi:hypothetical protein